MREKWKWGSLKTKRLNMVITIINELIDYIPLTIRQIHYQLVGKGLIENNRSMYNTFDLIIKYGRIDGYIPWTHIEDRSRTFYSNRGWKNKEPFIKYEREIFLEGYKRNLQQDQENQLEIWIEKDALTGVFQRIAEPYCIPVQLCKGFNSIYFQHKFEERILTCQKNNQQPVMLYFGDYDPSGKIMLDSMKITLEEEMGIKNVIYDPVAINLKQIEKYKLPGQMLKKKDSRYKNFVANYGDRGVELDALKPSIIQGLVAERIEKYLDLDDIVEQKKVEERELELIKKLKKETLK